MLECIKLENEEISTETNRFMGYTGFTMYHEDILVLKFNNVHHLNHISTFNFVD